MSSSSAFQAPTLQDTPQSNPATVAPDRNAFSYSVYVYIHFILIRQLEWWLGYSIVGVLHVRFHMDSLGEPRLTEKTHKRLLAPVDRVEVSFQVRGRDESVSTLAAGERLHASVRHLMLAQVGKLLELLFTGMATLVQLHTVIWLLSSVNSLVGDKVALLVKIFLTDFTLVITCAGSL